MGTFKNLKKLSSILTMFILIFLSECGSASHNSNSTFSTNIQLKNSKGQEATTFLNGESITFIVSVQNLTSVAQTLNFSSSQHYDVVVNLRNGGTPLWNWAYGKAFLAVLTSLQFAPNEIKTFSVTWDQKNNNGSIIGPGGYQGQGIIVSHDFSPSELQSAFVPFSIQ